MQSSNVDELFADHKISTQTEAALRTLTGKHVVMDVIATVGFYSTLGYILNTFEIPLDQDIATQLRADPLIT